MGLRNKADVLEEYNAARAAWLKAVEAEKIDYSSGTASRSLERSKSTELKSQMNELAKEYDSLDRGGIKSFRAVPLDD